MLDRLFLSRWQLNSVYTTTTAITISNSARTAWWSTDCAIAGAMFAECVTERHFQESLRSLGNGRLSMQDLGKTRSRGKAVRFKCPIPWQMAIYYTVTWKSRCTLTRTTVLSDFSESIKSGLWQKTRDLERHPTCVVVHSRSSSNTSPNWSTLIAWLIDWLSHFTALELSDRTVATEMEIRVFAEIKIGSELGLW